MRAVDIGTKENSGAAPQWMSCFKKNFPFYIQEAAGLGIFMISACLFSGLFFGEGGYLVSVFPEIWRHILLGLLMGLTALFIFYSPITSPSTW